MIHSDPTDEEPAKPGLGAGAQQASPNTTADFGDNKRRLGDRDPGGQGSELPETEHERSYIKRVLDEALTKVPAKYREVIVACDVEGKSRKQVAGELGLPEGTVATWLVAGRPILTNWLGQHGVTLSDVRELRPKRRARQSTAPFLPDDKKWVWRPESQILRDLGFIDPYAAQPENRDPTYHESDKQFLSTLESIIDPNDPRRQALRLVVKDLLADPTRRYRLPARRDPISKKQLEARDEGFTAAELIGTYSYQADRIESVKFSPEADVENDSEAVRRKPSQKVVMGMFFDPRVVLDGMITPKMIREKLALVEAGQASDLVDIPAKDAFQRTRLDHAARLHPDSARKLEEAATRQQGHSGRIARRRGGSSEPQVGG